MKTFCLTYNNINLLITCDDYMKDIIERHFLNHATITSNHPNPTYKLIISDNLEYYNGDYYKMIDKWFDNATLDCFIDNKNKTCYATNFNASTYEYKVLLIRYFVANLFNRFLEINGYLGLHSSCVEENGKGIAFVADRNSGKTNCMLNLMSDGFNVITNDKIALKKNNDGIVGYGIAQPISIRLSPEFCKQSQNQKYVLVARQKNIDIKDKNMLEGNNIVIDENDVADLNGVRQVFDAQISCIVKPYYDPFLKNIDFKRLTSEQLDAMIFSQYMPLVHDTTDFFRNIKFDDVNEKKLREETIEYLRKIPCYICGQNEYTTDEFVKTMRKIIIQ